jgi:hypothetical protein
VKPTYLVTYPVADDTNSASALRTIVHAGSCEIGSHCHPWNTPPLEEERNDWNSMLCNLPAELQVRKIRNLHQIISDKFGHAPISFRAGRWGFGDDTISILRETGYKVDSSILAYQDWRDYGGPDYSNIPSGIFLYPQQKSGNNGSSLLEVPASAGFTRNNFPICERIWRLTYTKSLQTLHTRGMLSRLGILNKVWLSPETSTTSEMIKLTKVMMNQGYYVANMFFHSTALMAGLSPFVKTTDEEHKFIQRIKDFLIFTRHAGIESIKLSGVPAHIQTKEMAHS